MKRRTFNKALLSVSPALIHPLSLVRNNSVENDAFNFDLHIHPGQFFRRDSPEYPGDQAFSDRLEDMKTHNIHGGFFSLVADWPLLQITDNGIVPQGKFEKGEGWNAYKKQIESIKFLLGKEGISIHTNTEDHDSFHAFLSCEGGDFLDGEIENVRRAFDDGVRSIQLVHYAPNLLGDLQTWKAEHGGLSNFGKSVVKKMNALGMLIDVAHASLYTVKDVIDLTRDPVILSHSILKTKKERPIGARAISVEHAKMIAATGGVIGMWPSGFSDNLDDFVDHTFRMIDAVGIDHVGIGTDMDANFKPVIANYNHYEKWRNKLESKGLSKDEVNKVCGMNCKRVIDKVCK